jgi:hypothetical protein
METEKEDYKINENEGFKDGGFFPIDKALDLITYSQDKSLVRLSFKRYKEYKEDVNEYSIPRY